MNVVERAAMKIPENMKTASRVADAKLAESFASWAVKYYSPVPFVILRPSFLS